MLFNILLGKGFSSTLAFASKKSNDFGKCLKVKVSKLSTLLTRAKWDIYTSSVPTVHDVELPH